MSLYFTACVLALLIALFQVAKQNYADARQKSESPNACYSPLNGISHAGHITWGWDLQRKGIFKSEFNRSKTQEPSQVRGSIRKGRLLKTAQWTRLQKNSPKKIKINLLCLILPNISLDEVGMRTINIFTVKNNNYSHNQTLKVKRNQILIRLNMCKWSMAG